MAIGLGLVKRKCEVGPSASIWAAGRSERQALLWCPRGPPRPAPPHACSVPRPSSGCSVSRGRHVQDGGRPAIPLECSAPSPRRGGNWVIRSIRLRGQEPVGRADGHLCTGPGVGVGEKARCSGSGLGPQDPGLTPSEGRVIFGPGGVACPVAGTPGRRPRLAQSRPLAPLCSPLVQPNAA